MQAQYLMVLAQRLQGMALSLQPTLTAPLFTPEVPLQPPLQFQAFPTSPPPLLSPQLLIAPTMGVSSLPLVHAPYTTQHFTLAFGGQPLGMIGA